MRWREKPMESNMKIGRALGIVHDIENESISDRDKATAIYVLCIRTERLNDLQKKEMFSIIRWLWKRCFRVCRGEKQIS